MRIQKLKHLLKCRKGGVKTRTVIRVINAVISGDYFLTAPNSVDAKVAYIIINKTFNHNEFGVNLFHPYVRYKMITI